MLRRLILLLSTCLFGSHAVARDAQEHNAYEFEFTSILGESMPLSNYRGKAILIVNTASECGFTGQYESLQKLWEAYESRGLVVIGVPANDFGGQEPGSESEIKDFCESKFAVTFPLTSKTVVSGDDAHPFFRAWREQFGWAGAPKWNFHKFLIGPDGRFVDYFNSSTTPLSENFLAAIEKTVPISKPLSGWQFP